MLAGGGFAGFHWPIQGLLAARFIILVSQAECKDTSLSKMLESDPVSKDPSFPNKVVSGPNTEETSLSNKCSIWP